MRYYHYTITGQQHSGPKSACPICNYESPFDSPDPESDEFYI